MNQEERIAFIRAQVVCAEIELTAMRVANMECFQKKEPLKYSEDDFRALTNQFLIGHNDVVSYLTGQ